MSYDLTRGVWAARDAGALPGGTNELLVALALADRSRDRGGRVQASVRLVAKRTGMAVGTASAALHRLTETGTLVLVDRGIGTKGSTYQFDLASYVPNARPGAQPVGEGVGNPALPVGERVDNGSQRAAHRTVASAQRSDRVVQRSPDDTLACHQLNKNQDQYVNKNADPPVHSAQPEPPPIAPDVVDRVAGLRAALSEPGVARDAPANPAVVFDDPALPPRDQFFEQHMRATRAAMRGRPARPDPEPLAPRAPERDAGALVEPSDARPTL